MRRFPMSQRINYVAATISEQPTGGALVEGELELTVVAAGSPALTYQWQQSDNGSTGWANVSAGGNAAVYTATAAKFYRCIVSNAKAATVTSSVVEVTAE